MSTFSDCLDSPAFMHIVPSRETRQQILQVLSTPEGKDHLSKEYDTETNIKRIQSMECLVNGCATFTDEDAKLIKTEITEFNNSNGISAKIPLSIQWLKSIEIITNIRTQFYLYSNELILPLTFSFTSKRGSNYVYHANLHHPLPISALIFNDIQVRSNYAPETTTFKMILTSFNSKFPPSERDRPIYLFLEKPCILRAFNGSISMPCL